MASQQTPDKELRKTAPRASATPQGKSPSSSAKSPHFSHGRKSSSIGVSPRSPGGGSALLIDSVSTERVRGQGASAAFRSTTSIGDAHIKDLAARMGGSLGDSHRSPGGRSTDFHGSKSPSDRDAHIRPLLDRTYATSPLGGSSPSSRGVQPSASYRSGSPIACAHIVAMPKLTDASYAQPLMGGGGSPSASYRSKTSIADAHIKAMTKPSDTVGSNLTPSTPRTCSSPFKSTTSIGDAHIKALPKPVDTVVAYRDLN